MYVLSIFVSCMNGKFERQGFHMYVSSVLVRCKKEGGGGSEERHEEESEKNTLSGKNGKMQSGHLGGVGWDGWVRGRVGGPERVGGSRPGAFWGTFFPGEIPEGAFWARFSSPFLHVGSGRCVFGHVFFRFCGSFF